MVLAEQPSASVDNQLISLSTNDLTVLVNEHQPVDLYVRYVYIYTLYLLANVHFNITEMKFFQNQYQNKLKTVKIDIRNNRIHCNFITFFVFAVPIQLRYQRTCHLLLIMLDMF